MEAKKNKRSNKKTSKKMEAYVVYASHEKHEVSADDWRIYDGALKFYKEDECIALFVHYEWLKVEVKAPKKA